MGKRTLRAKLCVVVFGVLCLGSNCQDDSANRSGGTYPQPQPGPVNTQPGYVVPQSQLQASPEPHRCPVCNGTGNITQSTRAALPERSSCQQSIPNFFTGERTETFTIANDGDQGGAFIARVYAIYPGGGRTLAGSGEVYIEAHQTSTAAINFTPSAGIITATCEVTAPTAVQQSSVVCPECHGRGFVL